jgi:hypothetical protein
MEKRMAKPNYSFEKRQKELAKKKKKEDKLLKKAQKGTSEDESGAEVDSEDGADSIEPEQGSAV